MIEWLPPPDELGLHNGSVHVWAVDLDDASFDANREIGVLSSAEQARAAKFKFERDRGRYVVAHIALRQILSRYVETAAAKFEFVEVGNGKPKLAPSFGASGVEFNLSHSNERALVSVARGCEVGVDIEFVKVDFPFNDIAGRFFTVKEVATLRALPVDLQRQAFYKCWTSKEAFLKAKGTGLSGKLDEVEIILEGDERVRIDARVPGWSLVELNPGDGYEASLVSAGKAAQFQVYRWQPTR